MSRKIDLTNKRFGRLLVLRQCSTGDFSKSIWWETLCDCGRSHRVSGVRLRNGQCTSCGCYQREQARKNNITHGMTDSPLYRVWHTMRSRCTNHKVHSYKHYGGRGIRVCKRWQKFQNFYNDVHKGYKPGLQLDRINNDGHYEPGNVRWVTAKRNARNKRNNTRITFNGETKTLPEWAELTGIKKATLANRIHSGWDLERVFNEPTGSGLNLYTIGGETHCLRQWALLYEVPYKTLWEKVERKGVPIEEALFHDPSKDPFFD